MDPTPTPKEAHDEDMFSSIFKGYQHGHDTTSTQHVRDFPTNKTKVRISPVNREITSLYMKDLRRITGNNEKY